MTDEENAALYGKCNNPYGHGHDYEVHISVRGAPDERGRVIHLAALDRLVQEMVIQRLDHRDLNHDVPELSGVVPTTENLALGIERILREAWTFDARLDAIRIQETDRNRFELSCYQ